MVITFTVISALSHNSNCLADDNLTPGPGLFSGNSGEFSLTRLIGNKSAKNDQTANDENQMLETVATSNYRRDRKTHKSDEKTDFEAYKEWHKLHQQNPDLYDNFEVWLEYQSYLKTK
jgi:hypothetical protein